MEIMGGIAAFLDCFNVGDTRYLEVDNQDQANTVIKKIAAKSARWTRTKEWRFVCSTMLAMNVSDATEQQMLVQVTALGPKASRFEL